MDLDEVRALLDLAPGGQDHLIDRAYDLCVSDLALVGDESAGRTPHRCEQCGHARRDPRALDPAGSHGISDCRAHSEDRVGIGDRSDSGKQQLGKMVSSGQRGQRVIPVEEQLVVAAWLVEGEVAVRVDQPGHHGAPSGVHTGHTGRRCTCGTIADSGDEVALHEHVGSPRNGPGPVDQRSAFDEQRARRPCPHNSPWCLCRWRAPVGARRRS